MPDWVQYVRRHLALLGLNPEREAEIVEDLAHQLEDAYRDALARGDSEQRAVAYAHAQIPNWESFAAELRQAEQRHRQSHIDQWYDRADQAVARKGGHWTMFADLRRDLLYGIRMLAKNPGFTAVVLLTLALGIGGNTAVFSVVNNVILRPLPFENEEQLVRIRNYNLVPGGGRSLFNVNGRQFAIIREQNQVFSAVVALQSNSGVILGGDEPERISLIGVSNGWSSTLGVEPVWGRLFSPEEQRLGMESGVALINYGIWQNRFGGDANVLGKSLRVDDRSYLIIGVFPQGFNFPYVGDVWVPAKDEEISSAAIFSRMKPGVGLDQARAEMDAL
ncbi:MAG: ABC transporter permease, partial [Nitrospiraceae bacterium]